MHIHNRRFILAKRPDGSNFDGCFEMKKEEIDLQKSPLKSGEVLVKVIYLSLDPAMRIWISGVKSYVEPVKINETMRSTGIGVVLKVSDSDKSSSNGIQEGSYICGEFGWQEYAVVSKNAVHKIPQPSTIYLNELGFIGQTAYWGIIDRGQIKKGDRVFVSTAAGAVGSLVCQIAKIKGCHVVGCAGSDDKVAWLRDELGIEAFNYKKVENVEQGGYVKELQKHFPDGIDVYFDNVGGELLEASLSLIRDFGRIVVCGAISTYNQKKVTGIRNYTRLIFTQSSMNGLLVMKYIHRFEEAAKEMLPWLEEGKLKGRVHVAKGFESLPETFPLLFSGDNFGKLLVQVSEPESSSKL